MGRPDAAMESMLLGSTSNNVENEIEILKSLNLAKRVANALNLQTKYVEIGNIKESLIYPQSLTPLTLEPLSVRDTINGVNFKVRILNANEYILNEDDNTRYRFGQVLQIPEGSFSIRKNNSFWNKSDARDFELSWRPLEAAGFEVLEGLKVNAIRDRTDIILLSYQTIQPQLGKDILNQLTEEYNLSSVEDKNQIAARTISFINDRLNLIATELGDVEKNLQQFKQQNQVIDLGTQSKIYLEGLSEVDKEQAQTEVKLSVIKYLRDYVEKKGNEYSIVPSTLGVEEPILVQLVTHYNEIQLQRERQLRTTTSSNPLIVSLEQQLEKLRMNLRENLKNVYNSTMILKNDLTRKDVGYKSSITSVPIKEKELLEITRQQGIKQTLYLFLLQKREESAISLAATISNSKVVDRAIANTTPIKPDHFNVKLLSVFLGLLVPVGFVYMREVLNDKINNRSDIQKVTQVPIFGEIGHSEKATPLVVQKNSRNVISEQFRMIRSNLQYLVNKVEKPVILVTSTFSGEGKSFVSINIGAVLALAGKKTVILEFDIRKPKIVAGFNLKRVHGITSYLVGNVELSELPIAVPEVEGLYVIPCGPIPPNPAELLLEDKIQDIFDYAKKNFDIVIVDTAPVGLVSDALSLGKYVDCTLYLVRLEYTLKKQINFIDEIYRKEKLPQPAILVNDIKTNTHYYSYGNYSGYGYGSSKHGYFDSEVTNSKNIFVRLWKKLGL